MIENPKPRRRRTILLAALLITGFGVSGVEMSFIDQPGMMDACYYYSGGLNLVRGQWDAEYFIWNFLDDSAALPRPSYQYWMPLTSLVAAVGMTAFGEGFRQSQLMFLLLGAAFPCLVFLLGERLTGNLRISVLAGFLAVFSGFYTVFWMNTESFLLYAWLGGLLILLAPKIASPSSRCLPFLAGILCGLAHMTRADGILFLATAGLALLADRSLPNAAKGKRILQLVAGYLAAAGIWYARNIAQWGGLFPPGTGKALWLTEYNDMFVLPSSAIGWERFLSNGAGSILSARWDALLGNALTLVFVLGSVFLFPFLCRGAFLLRRTTELRMSGVYLLLIFVVMTVAYPFQGSRGGFLHSSAALLSVAAVAAAAGVDDVVVRLSRWRNWPFATAQLVLEGGFVLLALFASGMVFFNRVVGSDPTHPEWSRRYGEYSLGAAKLTNLPSAPIKFIANTPPCFHTATGWEAIPVPYGGPEMLREAVERYGIQFVILDDNAPEELDPLFTGETEVPWLRRLFTDEYDGMTYVWFRVVRPIQEDAG
jgi:hypothetical protein